MQPYACVSLGAKASRGRVISRQQWICIHEQNLTGGEFVSEHPGARLGEKTLGAFALWPCHL